MMKAYLIGGDWDLSILNIDVKTKYIDTPPKHLAQSDLPNEKETKNVFRQQRYKFVGDTPSGALIYEIETFFVIRNRNGQ